MEKHVITGGSGFIGRHVAWLLASQHKTVTIASRTPLNFEFPPDISKYISWVQLDTANANWDKLLEEADVVHHYAWTSLPASANSDPPADLAVNVTATLRLLDAARRRGCRVVFASSGGTVYGVTLKVPVPEEHPLAPITAYGAGKAAAEIYLNLYRSLHRVDCRIARLANPYGAGQNTERGQGAVSVFLGKALRNEPIVIWGDGAIVRDYIHICDAAASLVKLAQARDLGDHCVFNIGSGVGYSLNDVIIEIERLLDRRLNVEYAFARSFDVPVNILSIKRAQQILGWEPLLSFPAGLSRMLADMRADRRLSTIP
jgi:UDP-glucose 4-epimerase